MSFASVASLLADVATGLGVPIFVISYVAGVISERRRVEEATYDALDDRYIAWQHIAAANPRLDLGDYSHPREATELSADEVATRRILYQILLSTFERAFLMYRKQSSSLRRRQWEGWLDYIDGYCRRPAFVDAYFGGHPPSDRHFGTFDRDFEAFMIERLRRADVEMAS